MRKRERGSGKSSEDDGAGDGSGSDSRGGGKKKKKKMWRRRREKDEGEQQWIRHAMKWWGWCEYKRRGRRRWWWHGKVMERENFCVAPSTHIPFPSPLKSSTIIKAMFETRGKNMKEREREGSTTFSLFFILFKGERGKFEREWNILVAFWVSVWVAAARSVKQDSERLEIR